MWMEVSKSHPDQPIVQLAAGEEVEIRLPLLDHSDPLDLPEGMVLSDDPWVNTSITISDQGIGIRFEGYGMWYDRDASVIWIELHNNEPRILAWPDINDDDSEEITFIGAKHDNAWPREEDDDDSHPE